MQSLQQFWLGVKSMLRSGRQLINAELESLQLSSSAGDVLFQLITSGEGLTQDELAKRLDVDKGAVSRTVASLEAAGYVNRDRDPDDARAYRVTLTAKGSQIEPLILGAYQRVYDIATRHVSEAELRQMAALLERVNRNFQSVGENA